MQCTQTLWLHAFGTRKNWVIHINSMRGKKNENPVNARFTQGLFQKLTKFITQSYLSLLNSFSFLSRFSVSLKSLNNYFFRRFAYTSLLNRLSVLINYVLCDLLMTFSTPSCFPRFSGPRFFRVEVFQCPRFSGSRFFWVQVFQEQCNSDRSGALHMSPKVKIPRHFHIPFFEPILQLKKKHHRI